MSSLSPKDRVSLCSFTFSDGRRCRTPRTRNNPRFCPYHAQKEARARAVQKLGKDLDYFFSGDYLSACDLSTALARLIPAVVRGDVKSKTARTIAYLAQTLMQSIHLSKHEYINTFGTDGWRKSIRNSVNGNRDYLFPPAPKPEQPALSAPQTNLRSESPQPQPPAVAHPFRGEALRSTGATSPAPPPTHARQPSPSPQTSLPPTSAEFVQHVVAGLQTGAGQAPQPAVPPSNPPQPVPVAHPFRGEAFRSAPTQPRSPIPAQAPPTPAPVPSPTPSHAPQTPAAHTAPSHTAGHPLRSERSCLNHAALTADETHPIPATQPARSVVPPDQPDNPPRTRPFTPQPAPDRVARALHFDHSCRLLIDGKPF